MTTISEPKKADPLEETAAKLHESYKQKGNIGHVFHETDFLYKLQGRILHESDGDIWLRAIELFNSLPRPYREFAFHGYADCNRLVADRKNYQIKPRQ